jgi:RNA polymerase sigma factor (TIGR02999 family)
MPTCRIVTEPSPHLLRHRGASIIATVEDTTQLLLGVSRGDSSAAARLMPLVYDELRSLAACYLRKEASDHTLQPTALVHEAYLRLVDMSRIEWRGRAQFMALAARQIRKILVDHARRRKALKRGAARQRVAFAESLPVSVKDEPELLALDEALTELADLSERQSQVVELRFFAGMRIKEIADVLGVSTGTVNGDWRAARAWLRQRMNR